MPEVILSDYFYGDESEEFVFFKIPRQLITNPKFKHVSTDAKLLYGMLLDRMSLSARNGWYDDTGRVYIYYSLDEICGDMSTAGQGHEAASGAGHEKGHRPDRADQAGPGKAHENLRQAVHHPDHTAKTGPASPGAFCARFRGRFSRLAEVGKIDFQKSKNSTLIILRETRQSLFRLIHPPPKVPLVGIEDGAIRTQRRTEREH